MSEESKTICNVLIDALNQLPDEAKEKLQRDWTSEAIGAKKAYDMLNPEGEESKEENPGK